ncbi:MAG: polysaccharide deacetylase family protein [Alphaproteobacteria bacterium]
MTPLLLVNYHYVRPRDAHPHPGIHPISAEELDAQVAALKADLHAATPQEVEAWAAGDDRLPGPAFFLTFDDGLIDHHEAVPAVLAKHGVRAAFFVNSRPLSEGRAITVHKVHWLRAETAPAAFRAAFLDLLPAEGRALVEQHDAARAAAETNRYDPPEIARLKYAINFLLPYEQVDAASAAMLRARGLSESDFCEMFYMTAGQISGLRDAGHVIGSHAHSHRPLSRLDHADADVVANLDCLERISGRRPDWLSYPWGSPWSIPDDAEALCRRHGFRLAITLNRDWNRGGEPAHLLNRVNTNEVDAMLRQRPAA